MYVTIDEFVDDVIEIVHLLAATKSINSDYDSRLQVGIITSEPHRIIYPDANTDLTSKQARRSSLLFMKGMNGSKRISCRLTQEFAARQVTAAAAAAFRRANSKIIECLRFQVDKSVGKPNIRHGEKAEKATDH